MTLFFFIILTVAWLVVFFPKALRARRSSPLPAAESFRKRLELLAPPAAATAGRWVHLPEDPRTARQRAVRRAQARKRNVLVILFTATAGFFLAALVWPVLWRAHLTALGLLVTYIVLLVGARRRREDVRARVRPLPVAGFADRGAESATGGAP